MDDDDSRRHRHDSDDDRDVMLHCSSCNYSNSLTFCSLLQRHKDGRYQRNRGSRRSLYTSSSDSDTDEVFENYYILIQSDF